MMAMYSLEARHRRFTLAFAFGCFVVQCIRLPYGRLALWSRRDNLVCVCPAQVSIRDAISNRPP